MHRDKSANSASKEVKQLKTSLLFFIVILITMTGCMVHQPLKYKHLAGSAQGTTYHITYENEAEIDLTYQIDSILKAFDLTFSNYIPNSIISRINKNDSTVEINDMFTEVFNKSREVYEASGGAFDITVAPLVAAWGFGPEKKEKVNRARIDSIMQFVGMNKIRLSGKKLIKDLPGITIDMNGIAQGYSVDIVSRFFDSKGLKNYMVEIGGEVRAQGKNDKGKTWRIGVDKPSYTDNPGENLQAILLLENKAMTTAGNYRNYFEENGVKYSHIIDPHTGNPVRNRLLSVTIVANDALTADGYDTPCMVLGLEGTRELLKKHPELDAYLIFNDEKGNYQVEFTKGIKIDE
jgi:FAD:protein FMN transferase